MLEPSQMWSDIFLPYHKIMSCQAAHSPPALKADIKREIEGLNAETSQAINYIVVTYNATATRWIGA